MFSDEMGPQPLIYPGVGVAGGGGEVPGGPNSIDTVPAPIFRIKGNAIMSSDATPSPNAIQR